MSARRSKAPPALPWQRPTWQPQLEALEASILEAQWGVAGDRWTTAGRELLAIDRERFIELLRLAELYVTIHRDVMSVPMRDAAGAEEHPAWTPFRSSTRRRGEVAPAPKASRARQVRR